MTTALLNVQYNPIEDDCLVRRALRALEHLGPKMLS